MNNLRKTKKKGFTLVEIIVVLVIIAILMAALTPVIIGWINEARDRAAMAEGRTGLIAAQSLVAEGLGLNNAAIITAAAPAINDGTAAIKAYTGGRAAPLFQSLLGDLPEARFTVIEFNANGTILRMTYTVSGRAYAYTSADGWRRT